jgi:hypothetical protein
MKTTINRKSSELPAYWTILGDEDKIKYHQLRKLLNPLSTRTSRSQLAVKFRVTIMKIQEYSIRNDADDWKRCLVCGVAWLDGSLALSTRQLCKLIGKCKSSINAGFQSIGYVMTPIASKHAAQLVQLFHCLAENATELRQWSIRSLNGAEKSGMQGMSPPDIVFDPLEDGLENSDLSYDRFQEQERFCPASEDFTMITSETDNGPYCSSEASQRWHRNS